MTIEEKQKKYEEVLKSAELLVDKGVDTIANMANLATLLHTEFNFWWTGFYRVQGEHLVLGPYQGPLACTRIHFGRGVCGTAWKQAKTIVVPDVEEFPGHIACSSLSRSEIVVPVFNNEGVITSVLDIDSRELGTFDEIDAMFLEKFVKLL